MLSKISLLLTLVAAPPTWAQSISAFPLRQNGPVLRQPVQSGQPFTVAGSAGILVGQQQGLLEAWVLPIKLLSGLSIQADVEGYPVPLDLNSMAREIEVRPDRTTVTYSHIAVTVRQIMFSPDAAPAGTGPIILFQVDAVRPVTLTIRFTPDMRPMWPKPSSGTPSAEWVQQRSTTFYALHTDDPALTAAVTIPGATPGIMAPYQERPQVHPLELHLAIDPKRDSGKFFPLLMAVGRTPEAAKASALATKLAALNSSIPDLYAAHVQTIADRGATLTTLETPDSTLNQAFLWAEASIEQLRAHTPSGETALVAGYYASGDSARPGFGWFFGRDALYTIPAIDSFGDFALTRSELDFLIARQRPDGKIMHEFSQTAAELRPPNDWASFPYEYAAADSTPLFLIAVEDYLQASGDLAFVRANRSVIEKAWKWETTHDSDGDGILDNTQGTGWVESWPTGMPKQEIYLASLDQQASTAMSQLASALDDPILTQSASTRATQIQATLESEYYQPATGTYAFSHNPATDTTRTIYPAIAWWTTTQGLARPATSLRQWASHDFATDWGARDIAESDPLYDPISYHQGSVWPLFTGWAAMAQYRTGHPLAGYQATMQNVDLTTAQDLGAVTELLSGVFFEPFGRSTSHQLWSSAMVITPVLRGIFGLQMDAVNHTVSVSPQLPADWLAGGTPVWIRNLHVGESIADLSFTRSGTTLIVSIKTLARPALALKGASSDGKLRITLPAVQVVISHGLPSPGSRTAQMKVIAEKHGPRSLELELEGIGGSRQMLRLVRNAPNLKLATVGGPIKDDVLEVTFPNGSGSVRRSIKIEW
jgi:hypothetical protein